MRLNANLFLPVLVRKADPAPGSMPARTNLHRTRGVA